MPILVFDNMLLSSSNTSCSVREKYVSEKFPFNFVWLWYILFELKYVSNISGHRASSLKCHESKPPPPPQKKNRKLLHGIKKGYWEHMPLIQWRGGAFMFPSLFPSPDQNVCCTVHRYFNPYHIYFIHDIKLHAYSYLSYRNIVVMKHVSIMLL